MQAVKYEKNMTITAKVDSATTIAEGQLGGINSSGNAVLATNLAAGPITSLGVAVRSGAGSKNDYVALAPVALVRGFTSLTPGGAVYLATGGGITQTRPTIAGTSIQPVGTAVSAVEVAFVVTPPFALAQAAATTTLG